MLEDRARRIAQQRSNNQLAVERLVYFYRCVVGSQVSTRSRTCSVVIQCLSS
jgi:hypothetical protein